MNQFESTELATPSHTQTAGEHNESPERENALPDLDEEVVGKWKSFLSADKFEELVASQLEGAKGQVERLWAAGQSGQLDEIKGVAHDVKSVCGNLGMAKICHLAGGLEAACLSGQKQEVSNLLQAIKQAMPSAATAFKDCFVSQSGAN